MAAWPDRVDRTLVGLSVGTLVVVGVAWSLSWPLGGSAFDLSARSEVLRITTRCRTQPRWYLAGAILRSDGKETGNFNGQIEVGPRAEIVLERIGTGPVRIAVRRDPAAYDGCSQNESRDLAIVVSSEDVARDGETVAEPIESAVEESLLIETPADAAGTVFAFMGWAEVGQSIKSATRAKTPMLTSGNVTFLRHSALSLGESLPHLAGSVALNAGDHFIVRRQEEAGYGFVRIDGEAGLQVGYRATGHGAEVERFGTRSYAVGPTLLDSLQGDVPVQFVLMLFGALGALGQTLKTFRRSDPTTAQSGTDPAEVQSGEAKKEQVEAESPELPVL